MIFRYVVPLALVAVLAPVSSTRLEDEIMSRDRLLAHLDLALEHYHNRLNDPNRQEEEEDMDALNFSDFMGAAMEEEDEEDRGLQLLLRRKKRVDPHSTQAIFERAFKKEAAKVVVKNKLGIEESRREPRVRPGAKVTKRVIKKAVMKPPHSNPPGLFENGRFTRIPSPFELRVHITNRVFPVWLLFFLQPCRAVGNFIDLIDVLPIEQFKALCPESQILRRDCDRLDAIAQATVVCDILIGTIEFVASRIPLINTRGRCQEACEIWYATFCSQCTGTTDGIVGFAPLLTRNLP